jgi:2-polyprenyl-6-methoxyphenol hydroxylase-like FAD-dependent oxidoreductase
MRSARIAIVGAGPAGLTAALAASQLGLAATVFEQAPDFARVGGGILIHSNGQRVLDTLGLLDLMRPVMRPTQTMIVESPEGQPLCRFDYANLSIPHNRIAVVLRYDLQERLLAAATRAGVPIRFGHRCTEVSRRGDAVGLKFANGHAEEFDLVIASDGIHSPIRANLGLRAQEKHLGEAYLRGVADLHMEDSTIRELWGPDGRRFGICPLSGNQTYFYCSVPLGEWQDILPHRLEEWMAGWENFGPKVMAILKAVSDWSRVNYDELHEIKLARWYCLPVFVVGDAAHAMAPNLGQGANCAMVDSLVLMRLLAQALRTGDNLEDVGRAYESLRRPFVTRIQTASRQVGMLASWSSAPARFARRVLLWPLWKVGWLNRRAMLLAAGYHASEQL